MILSSTTNMRALAPSPYLVFHVQFIAFASQATAHGARFVSGLQGEHVNFILLRCSSVTDATVLSSRSMSINSS